MQMMQYSITLPADYDMNIIRQRVADKGHMTDHFPGLAFKAYLIRERGQHHSTVNQYAPFYLWRTDEGLGKFIWGGGGFQGIIDSFGRPSIHHWTLVTLPLGLDMVAATPPRWASKVTQHIPRETDLNVELARQVVEVEKHQQGTCSFLGLNIEKWELCTFTLWSDKPVSYVGELFEVLHLSLPQ